MRARELRMRLLQELDRGPPGRRRQPVRDFLTAVGVDEPCESEVIQHVARESGLHLYEGWLHFVGRIEEGSEPGSLVDVANVSVGFEARSDLAHDALRGSEPVQMTIQAEVPWLLDGPLDVPPAGRDA